MKNGYSRWEVAETAACAVSSVSHISLLGADKFSRYFSLKRRNFANEQLVTRTRELPIMKMDRFRGSVYADGGGSRRLTQGRYFIITHVIFVPSD